MPQTPPFMPQGDPLQGLDRLLGAPTTQAPAQPGLLDSIMTAIASGVGTFASNDPGQALLGQLDQIRQSRERDKLLYQQEQARRSAIRDQLAVTTIADNLGEQREIRKEQRVLAARKEETKEEREFLVSQANSQYAQQEKLSKISFDNQVKLASIENDYRVELMKNNQKFESDQNELRMANKELADRIELEATYMLGGMDAGTAASISKKRIRDDELSAKEIAAINKAYANLRAAKAPRGGGGGGGLDNKAMMSILTGTINDLRKEQMVELSDGRIVEASSLKMGADYQPILGSNPDGTPIKITRYLTADETLDRLGPKVLKSTMSLLTGRSPEAPQQVTGSPKDVNAVQIDGVVDTLRKRGYSSDAIKAALLQRQNDFGGSQAINQAFIRNGLNEKPKPEKPKAVEVKGKGRMGSYNRPF